MKHANRFALLWSFVSMFLLLTVTTQTAFSQVAGQARPLNPQKIPQFVDPLPHFAGIRVNAKTATDLTVRMVPHQQVAVSTGTKLATGTVGVTPGIGMANLWVYQIKVGQGTYSPPLWPAYTIETMRGNPLNVTYRNELYNETYAKVNLIVDQTLHWADPAGVGMSMTPYLGEPPGVVHLHGGEVPPWSDGGPDAWFLPGGPVGGRGHSATTNVYNYPNTQEAATLWYHDHTLGATRLNVYAGLAGFYFLRDPNEANLKLPGFSGDGMVQEVAPPGASGTFSAGAYLPEIEIVIQDRMFDETGQLYFPSAGVNVEHPFWVPEFIGDVITVNGKTWPYLSVAPRKYRFRMLNGSNARFYNLSFPKGGPTITQIGTDGGFMDAPVPLGNGPLLIAPGERADIIVDFTGFAAPAANPRSRIQAPPPSFILTNNARTPFPGGVVARGNTTGRIMEFVVNGTMVGSDLSTIPASLTTNIKLTDFAGNPAAGVPVTRKRQLTLNEVMGAAGPFEALVNNTKWNGSARGDFKAVTNSDGSVTYYSETLKEGETEIWQIINMTADAHPIHLHLVQFQLMSRQPYNVATYTATYDALFPGGGTDPMTGLPYPAGVFMGGYGPPLDYTVNQTPGAPIPTIGGNPDITGHLIGLPVPANVNEKGWKDTFIMYPGEVTTVIARWAPTTEPANADPTTLAFAFDPNGGHGYVWHCHIIDHEDNEMMRPYDVETNGLIPVAGRSNYVDIPLFQTHPAPAALAAGDALQGQPEAMELGIGSIDANMPNRFELSQNYPNPFNPSTEIRFSLPDAAHVTLTVYNSVGQEVKTLIDSDAPAGYHTVKVDGRGLSSGIYYYRIQAGSFTDVKSMILLK